MKRQERNGTNAIVAVFAVFGVCFAVGMGWVVYFEQVRNQTPEEFAKKNGDPTPLESRPVTSGEDDDEQKAADSVNRAVKSLAEKRESEVVPARGK